MCALILDNESSNKQMQERFNATNDRKRIYYKTTLKASNIYSAVDSIVSWDFYFTLICDLYDFSFHIKKIFLIKAKRLTTVWIYIDRNFSKPMQQWNGTFTHEQILTSILFVICQKIIIYIHIEIPLRFLDEIGSSSSQICCLSLLLSFHNNRQST